jgi:hypothetical protein
VTSSAACQSFQRHQFQGRVRVAEFQRHPQGLFCAWRRATLSSGVAVLVVDPAVVHTLATGDWVKKGLPLCPIGDSGTGMSHLLVALGTEAAMAGYRVRYVLATKLVNELVEAADDKILAKTIVRYGRAGGRAAART